MINTRFTFAFALLLGCTASIPAMAGDEAVTRVEEDWTFTVLNPAYPIAAPQIVNVISPVANLDGQFMMLEVNRATHGDYAPGGLQLQAWEGEKVVRIPSTDILTLLRYENETVTYTLSMQIRDEKLRVDVINGRSKSWGEFGTPGDLRVERPTSLKDLNSYSPESSVSNAAVEIGAHRIKKFALTEVRYYSSNNEILKRVRPNQTVHQYQKRVKFQTFRAYTATNGQDLVKTSDGSLESVPAK